MLTRLQVRRFATDALKVVNDVAKQQFTASLTGSSSEAILEYEVTGKNIRFFHTEVPQEFQGKGVGKVLAKHAFEYAQKNKLNVTCECEFLAKYYERNSNQYKDLSVKIDLEDK